MLSLYVKIFTQIGVVISLLMWNISCNILKPDSSNNIINTDSSNVDNHVYGSVTDIDGNTYTTVQIGNQEWMVENLRTTKYNDGSLISKITRPIVWDSCIYTNTPAFCYYNNTINADTIKKFGALYNWYVVSLANPKKIAPAGWHVPTDSEWSILEEYLVLNGYNWDGSTTGDKIAKSLASKLYWHTYSSTGTIGCDMSTNNRSGFTALPGGCCNYSGFFGSIDAYGFWWSSTAYNSSLGWGRSLFYGGGYIEVGGYVKSFGYSVRLVHD